MEEFEVSSNPIWMKTYFPFERASCLKPELRAGPKLAVRKAAINWGIGKGWCDVSSKAWAYLPVSRPAWLLLLTPARADDAHEPCAPLGLTSLFRFRERLCAGGSTGSPSSRVLSLPENCVKGSHHETSEAVGIGCFSQLFWEMPFLTY